MNKAELIAAIAESSGASKAATTDMFNAFVESVTAALKKGDSVQIAGFGSFQVRSRAARSGRNPATGETITLKASKTPVFKAGKVFRDAI